MKRLLRSSVLIAISLALSSKGLAETFGFVNSIKNGNVFLVDSNQSAKILKKGEFLEEDSQLLVEEGALITFSDYHDHQFLLSSGSLIQFKANSLVLSRGHLRIKTLSSNPENLMIETPNSLISLGNAEGVISFDPEQTKTNVFSFDGTFDFKSKKDPISSVEVWGGSVSFIKNGHQLGMPTIPERIGGHDLKKIASVFMEESFVGRNIASEPASKIIFIRAKPSKPLKSRKREPASTKKKLKVVPVNIYGNKSDRKPSSVPTGPTNKASGLDTLLKELKSQKDDPKSL